MFNLFKPQIRTRFAPSPTGYLHIGGLRTALYAYLFAKQNRGKFFLRIEDTDQTREIAGAVDNLIKALKWANITPDEGIIGQQGGKVAEKGNFGPYTQSQRLPIYRRHADELVKNGHAYHCFCAPERLEKLRHDQEAAKQPTKYDGLCRSLTAKQVASMIKAGEKHVIRMKSPDNKVIEFTDLVRGQVKVNSKEIDDQVLIKADGFPIYHLAHVVDDYLMKTTHIIRGEEWLPSTPKHLVLFEYFGWTPPKYAHLSLILNPDKSKLSKRQGDVAIEDYRDKGYLPEALVNYVALLGWNPGTEQEIFSLKELVKEFDVKKIHKAGAVFDVVKLNWMNGEYIKKLPPEKFVEMAMPYLEKNIGNIPDKKLAQKVLLLEQERISKLSEAGESMGFFFAEKLKYPSELLVWKKSNQAKTLENLNILMGELEKIPDWSRSNLEDYLLKMIKDRGLTNGAMLWPLRVALSGLEKSPPPFDIASILGKEISLSRIKTAIMSLQ